MKTSWYKSASEILVVTQRDSEYNSVDVVDLDEPTVRELYEFIKANYDTKWWDSFNAKTD